MRMPLIHTFIRFFYRRGMFGSQSPLETIEVHVISNPLFMTIFDFLDYWIRQFEFDENKASKTFLSC